MDLYFKSKIKVQEISYTNLHKLDLMNNQVHVIQSMNNKFQKLICMVEIKISMVKELKLRTRFTIKFGFQEITDKITNITF